ncbi:MAG: FAD-binding oxidoreductase [Bacteroidales bacterium]|jgi:alkyldihydroxyacetonephosphate synthase|nr:FAD-binding oxidoreductase [Bacteroidales bacterium]HNX84872.1 FAD-binding oxidoreductase [Bacteroidales bacterium]HPS98431.1 FAD-binding oxidoreductase [Bacteroidales bacterium]
MENGNSYRHILKWGDKHEEGISHHMAEVIKEKFDLSDADFKGKHLPGTEPVKLEKPSMLKPVQVDFFRSVSGAENIQTDDVSRARFSCGKFYGELLDLRLGLVPDPPDAVVAPRTHEEVKKIISFCSGEGIAVVPAGGLSSVTGAVRAPGGGIALDLTKHLNKVLAVNKVNKTVTVQAGMYGPALEEKLNRQGYSCGHFPQSFEYSTVGGWISARGAGQASTGYGKIEDMLVSVKVVTPAGVIVTRDFPRMAQGWDIFRLFAGAEGTLGVITEATLHVFNYAPENTTSAAFIFRSFEAAVEAMRIIIQAECGKPHLFRISDPDETDIAFRTGGFEGTLADRALQMLGFKTGSRCLMFVTVEGEKDYARFVIRKIKRKARAGKGLYIGTSPVRKWLEQRYSSAYMRDPLMDLGIMTDTLETAVTWENLLKVWKAAHEYVARRSKAFMMIHISHVYENGANLYFTFLSPMEKGNEKNDFTTFHRGLVETILEHGGSISHHHGVGRVLGPWMEGHLGRSSMELLRAVKKHLDPNNIMNPGGTLGL